MKNRRTFYMSLMLLIAVGFSIGYAFLSQSLKINGRAGIASNSWIIYFDNLLERPGSLEATTPATINATKDRIDFGITLTKPGDNYTFETDIVNDGSIDAMIDSVSLNGLPETLDGVLSWSVTYLNGTELRKCDELLHNSKRRIKVVVDYNKDIETLPPAQDLTLSLVVNYVQLDKTVCTTTNPATPDPIDPDDGRHTLTIDPNYGLYDGSDAVKTVRMVPGEVYVLADPIQEVHTFTGWTVDKPDTYNETSNVITMDDEDINAIAEWEWIITDEENNMGYCFGVGDNYFYNFDEAISAAGSKGTIKLLSNDCVIKNRSTVYNDFKIGEKPYDNESLKYATQDVDITFDLNGHKVDWISSLFNFAKFTIEDKSDSKNGEIIRPPKENNSVFENGMIINNDSAYARGVTTTFNDIKITDNRYGNIVRTEGFAIFRVNGGTYTSNYGRYEGCLVYSTDEDNEIYIYNAVININTPSDAIWVDNGYVEIDGLEINSTYENGTGSALIYLNSGIEDYSLKNINLNMNITAGSGYGIWLSDNKKREVVDLENINVMMSGYHTSMPVGIYAAYSPSSTKTINCINCSFDYDLVGGTNFVTSIYAQSSNYIVNLIDTDIDIKYTGGVNVFGTYASNLSVTNSNINIDVTGANNLYCVYGVSKANIIGTNVNCNVSGGVSTFYGFYSNDLTVNDTILNSDVYSATYYSNIYCHTCNVDDITIVSALNGGGYNGTYYGLSLDQISGNESSFNNIHLDYTLKNNSNYSYGFLAKDAIIENLDLTLNIPSENHSGKNVGFKLDNSTLMHSSLKVVNESSSYFYGVECSSCVIDDVDIDIDNNTTGGNPIYGFYGSDMDISNSELKISNNGNVQIYGLYSSNASSLNSSSIDIKTAGIASSYGVFGKDITSNNNEIKIEILNVNKPIYGYNLNGDSSISGGKIDVIGPDYPYENLGLMNSLNAVQSSDSLNISDYTINSKYSCVNFTGSTLTTNGVNMTCGGYGIQKGSESVVNSTETVVNAELE